MPRKRERNTRARARAIMGAAGVRQGEAFRPRVVLRGLLLAMAAFAGAAPAGAAPCVAQSGERTVALVELYLAQRCRGCAAAERWLSRLTARRSPEELLGLVASVDYADYLQRNDPNTGQRLVQRERKLLLQQRTALVYTPQVLLQGIPLQGWERRDMPGMLKHIHAQPARARLRLAVRSAGADGLAVRLEAEVLDAAQRPDARAYMAAIERGGPGEPARVLEWQGPFAPRENGTIREQRRLPILPGAAPAGSGVAAFVQSSRSAEVLQALLLAACSA